MGFAELVAEGAAVPVEGWDFSWFSGRATEQRPRWGYSRLLADRMARARVALDVQTGGGEVLAGVPTPPPVLVATEGWLPNVPVAAANLRAAGARVVASAGFPFRDNTFDLVSSRHPVTVAWAEIGRVLAPGGRYLSQQIGSGNVRELREAITGPYEIRRPLATDAAVAGAEGVGLTVLDLRSQGTRIEFLDIAAVVYFLRKVVWIVPDFTVDRYRDQLRAVHERIEVDGKFVSYSQRLLVEAQKPD